MIWNKHDIRQARARNLSYILQTRGYRLIPLESENFKVDGFGALLIKKNYWIWREKTLSGNAIDFFMKVENKTFFESMEIITQTEDKKLRKPSKIQTKKKSEMSPLKSILKEIMTEGNV